MIETAFNFKSLQLFLSVSNMAMIPSSLKDIIERQLKSSYGLRKYDPNLRKFALTLHYYSPRAYNFVRQDFENLLPHPESIRKWYNVIGGNPGFTKEAFDALQARCKEKNVIVNIAIDEMSIRQLIEWDGKKYHGFVDLGIDLISDGEHLPAAKNVLVFLAVSLNEHFKVPLGYFLISSLNGSERASLLEKCLYLLHKTGAKTHSVTFNGAPVNLNMCTELGDSFDVENLKPWFPHPITKDPVYTFWDTCHMIKFQIYFKISIKMENDAQLIECVCEYEFLYDKKHPQYKDNISKLNAWRNIAFILEKDVDDLQKRWVNLRKKYSQMRKKADTLPSGSGAENYVWPHYENLKFLNDHISQRITTSNIKISSNIVSKEIGLTDLTDQIIQRASLNKLCGDTSRELELSEMEIDSYFEIEQEVCSISSLPTSIPIPLPTTSTNNSPRCVMKSNKRKSTELSNVVEKAMESMGQYFKKRTVDNNIDEAFGTTVALMLNKVKGFQNKIQLQTKILNLISEHVNE